MYAETSALGNYCAELKRRESPHRRLSGEPAWCLALGVLSKAPQTIVRPACPDVFLHATDITNPTPTQLDAIAAFFRSQPFLRFGAICSIETNLDAGVGPLIAVARALANRLIDILKWQPFASVAIIFEHSERLAPCIEEAFGGLQLLEDGEPIPLELFWMSKSVGEPGLEVADFLANSIGTEVRHRIAKRPGHARNFEAFFHYPDRRLVSFMDISEVLTRAPAG